MELIPENIKTEERKEKIKAIFDKADIDHNGTLDKAEFGNAVFRLVMRIANDILATEMGPKEYLENMMGGAM